MGNIDDALERFSERATAHFIDHESQQVVELVLEVTRQKGETKPHYLQRVLNTGSRNALILKCADRISNLTDLHLDTHSKQNMWSYLKQTETYVFPMAGKVNHNMLKELKYLVFRRWEIVRMTEEENTKANEL